ncbi:MAG: PIN domain-containing protein [Deltaproteobacteria bacterium]|nr:PIN domain-containing protein [Deltaproteobacteria bacterium]
MPERRQSLILVDSSVWIDYYHPKGPEALKRKIQEELAQGTIATIGLIAVEVLQGAPSSTTFAALHEDFLGYHWLEITQDVYLEAARLSSSLRQNGVPVPTTDVVIAATALHYHATLWHRDDDFTRLSRHISTLHATSLS